MALDKREKGKAGNPDEVFRKGGKRHSVGINVQDIGKSECQIPEEIAQ